jgi:hypothetical protein
MVRGVIAGAVLIAAASFGACGDGDDDTAASESSGTPTEQQIADALGADAAAVASVPGGQDTSVPGCQIEEIVIGERQIDQYVSFDPESMAVNEAGTAGVQMPSSNVQTASRS